MKPGTVLIATVLLALGACGILDAAGVVDASQTIGQWWPLTIVGWAVADMLGERRVTLGGAICAAIGLTLLADAQACASDTLVWSSLAIFTGLAVLLEFALNGRERSRRGDSCSATRGSAS